MAGALKQLLNTDYVTLLECLFVPWISFLIKVCEPPSEFGPSNWNLRMAVDPRSLRSLSRWPPCLLQVFYFDLSPNLGSSEGVHATRISARRAAAWEHLHGPLIGSVLWINAALSGLIDLVDQQAASCHAYACCRACSYAYACSCAYSYADTCTCTHSYARSCLVDEQKGDATNRYHHQSANERRWSFVGAFSTFLLVCTCQQSLHRGSGRGSRKIGATNRFYLRLAFLAVLLALPPLYITVLGELKTAPIFEVVSIALLTILAAFELWGRGVHTTLTLTLTLRAVGPRCAHDPNSNPNPSSCGAEVCTRP